MLHSGTTTTLPFTCFTSGFEQQRFIDNLSPAPQPEDREAIGHLWAAAGNFGQACAQAQNETGSLIGTAFAARDVVSIATALGEKDKVRFWGVSFSSIFSFSMVLISHLAQAFRTAQRSVLLLSPYFPKRWKVSF